MSSKKNAHRKSLKAYAAEENSILGLDAFRLKVEKDFFCDVKITTSKQLYNSNDLVLEAKFNFELSQGLPLLANRQIGDLDLRINNENNCLFLNALDDLYNNNTQFIDIEEVNIIFNDCMIVIHRIFENSISSQLSNIISELYKNQLFYTKGYSKMPYEIHIPVFEQKQIDSDFSLLNIRMKANKNEDYFAFWGLYFEDTIDAHIYDFSNKEIIDGELTMINQ
tara:strand:- start:12764 stop:13432 length:669 start_codon:yes stop_codon:yes gene_type:complete